MWSSPKQPITSKLTPMQPSIAPSLPLEPAPTPALHLHKQSNPTRPVGANLHAPFVMARSTAEAGTRQDGHYYVFRAPGPPCRFEQNTNPKRTQNSKQKIEQDPSHWPGSRSTAPPWHEGHQRQGGAMVALTGIKDTLVTFMSTRERVRARRRGIVTVCSSVATLRGGSTTRVKYFLSCVL